MQTLLPTAICKPFLGGCMELDTPGAIERD